MIISRPEKVWKFINISTLINWTAVYAIIKNARSNKMGKKDIMKIECPIDFMDLDILGFIDHSHHRQYYRKRTNCRCKAAHASQKRSEM